MSRRFPRDVRDVGPGPALVIAGLAAFLALCAPLLHWLQVFLYRLTERTDASRPAAFSVLPPKPRLQADPAFDLYRMRLEEDKDLEGWGWRDRRAGLARVPIERAIDALARRPKGKEKPERRP